MSLFYVYTPYMQSRAGSSSLSLVERDNPTKLLLEWATSKGTGPDERWNEDGLLVVGGQDTLLLGVLDGVSSLEPARVVNGGHYASKHATMSLCDSFVQGERDLMAMLVRANDAVRDVSADQGVDFQDPTQLLATTATLLLIDFASRTLRYAHLGDSALMLKHHDRPWERATGNKVALFEGRAINLALSANPENPALAFLDPDGAARQMLAENRHHQNAPGGNGYGVLNGCDNSQLQPYIERSENPIPLDEIERFALLSDGATLTTREGEGIERGHLFDRLLFQHGVDFYLERIREMENYDSALKRFPRVKVHDDATIIIGKRSTGP
ncbi:MAG TPA: protein phosphatase 2C domain-containing protein [Chloroflexia bacterium]|nr:protein phosphatase 2C domain-containing protein [Chloroflexia bacterium]